VVNFRDAGKGANVLAVLLRGGLEVPNVVGEQFKVHGESLVTLDQGFDAFINGHGSVAPPILHDTEVDPALPPESSSDKSICVRAISGDKIL
jgi:hypothetical protein